MREVIKPVKETPVDILWMVDGLKKRILDMGYRRVIQPEKGQESMRSGVDDFLYQHGIPSDRHLLGTISLGKFVQGQALGPLRVASFGTSIGGILSSCSVVRHVML